MDNAADIGLVLDLYRDTVAPVACCYNAVLQIIFGVLSNDFVELGINALSCCFDISADLSQIARRIVADFVLRDDAAADFICSGRNWVKSVEKNRQDIVGLILAFLPAISADQGCVLQQLADLKKLSDAQGAAKLEAQE